jgi:hypothetical protein
LSVSKRSLEELLMDAARDFDVFYQERVAAPAAGSVLWRRSIHCTQRRTVKGLMQR